MADKKKPNNVKSGIVQQPLAQLKKVPAGYVELLEDLKERVHSARIRAGLAANRELVLLYWEIGRRIIEQQKSLGWGTKVVERLARDLQNAFPDMKGFCVQISFICGRLPRHTLTDQLSSRLLDKFHGSTIASFWTRSRTW